MFKIILQNKESLFSLNVLASNINQIFLLSAFLSLLVFPSLARTNIHRPTHSISLSDQNKKTNRKEMECSPCTCIAPKLIHTIYYIAKYSVFGDYVDVLKESNATLSSHQKQFLVLFKHRINL